MHVHDGVGDAVGVQGLDVQRNQGLLAQQRARHARVVGLYLPLAQLPFQVQGFIGVGVHDAGRRTARSGDTGT